MVSIFMKDELQNIISGKSEVRFGDAVQAITRYLRGSKSPSNSLKTSKQIKSEEAESLRILFFNRFSV